MTDSTDPQPFPPRDRLFALIASIPGSGTFDWCSPARALLDEIEAAAPPAADRADELAKHVTRAIFALKSPAPPGSEHYRSGWDDGLEAAIDAARDAVLRRVADEAQQPSPRCTCGETACESELCDCDSAPWPWDTSSAGPGSGTAPPTGRTGSSTANDPPVSASPPCGRCCPPRTSAGSSPTQ